MDTDGGVNNSTSNISNFINNQYIKSTTIVAILKVIYAIGIRGGENSEIPQAGYENL